MALPLSRRITEKPLTKYVLPLRSADDVGSRLPCTWPGVTLLAFPDRDVIDVA
jgi:hypothetical protein